MEIGKLEKQQYPAWDAFCAEHGTLFQSSLWAECKKTYYNEKGGYTKNVSYEIYAAIDQGAIVAGVMVLIYPFFAGTTFLYAPWGPVSLPDTDSKTMQTLCDGIKKQSKLHHVAFIKLDMRQDFTDVIKESGYKREGDVLMPKNIFLLKTDEEEHIRKNIPSKYRGRVRNDGNLKMVMYEKDAITPDIINAFYTLYAATGDIKGFSIRSKTYITHLIHFLASSGSLVVCVVYEQDILVASSINLIYNKEMSYLYSGIEKNPIYTKLFPGYVMIYECALWAHQHGIKTYNLWGGTLDPNPTHPWRGFTDFKTNMGAVATPLSGIVTWYLLPRLICRFLYHALYSLYEF